MDIELNFAQQGEGFPLVLLHGNGEDCTYFTNQADPFSCFFRVIAPETRGHGRTPRGDAPFTLEQFAEDLKEFLDSQGIQRCHLLGFSDGANIALLFALKYPWYVERLVLNGANLFPEGLVDWLQQEIAEKWYRLRQCDFSDPYVRREWELQDLMMTQPHIDPAVLAQLTMPVLVMAGDDDVIRPEHTQLIADAIPNSRLAILPGDHFIAQRNPRQYNDTVLGFLLEA